MNNKSVCRVLVVDDNVDAAETLAMLLRMDGHEVDIANDGVTAVRNALSFHPDVVLLDLGLPHLHGHDACRQLLEGLAPHRPLMIAVTGHGHRDMEEQSYRAGFDSHIVKPVNYDNLGKVIQAHCDARGDRTCA